MSSFADALQSLKSARDAFQDLVNQLNNLIEQVKSSDPSGTATPPTTTTGNETQPLVSGEHNA